jgi:chemotaxis protein MotA
MERSSANVMFMPMAKKLEGFYLNSKLTIASSFWKVCVELLGAIAPRNIQDQMAATLPPKLQAKFEIAA